MCFHPSCIRKHTTHAPVWYPVGEIQLVRLLSFMRPSRLLRSLFVHFVGPGERWQMDANAQRALAHESVNSYSMNNACILQYLHCSGMLMRRNINLAKS